MKRTPLRRRAQLRARHRCGEPRRCSEPSHYGRDRRATRCRRRSRLRRLRRDDRCRPGPFDPTIARRLRGTRVCVTALLSPLPPRVRHRRDRPARYLEPAWRSQLAHAVGHVGLIGALRRISGSATAAARGARRLPGPVADRALELWVSSVSNGGWQRGHSRGQRSARWTPAVETTDRARRQIAQEAPRVRAVSDAADDHGVHVEPEAERQHERDGSAGRQP